MYVNNDTNRPTKREHERALKTPGEEETEKKGEDEREGETEKVRGERVH